MKEKISRKIIKQGRSRKVKKKSGANTGGEGIMLQ